MELIREANELNRQSAQYLVESGDTEVKAGIKTRNEWLKMGTEIDRRVAVANQEATAMEAEAFILAPTDINKAASLLKEAAVHRRNAVLEKYRASEGLKVMLHLMGRRLKHKTSRRKHQKKRYSYRASR